MTTHDTPRVCVSIAEPAVDAALAAAARAESSADLIEIRLDFLSAPDPRPFVAALQKPLLFTNRASWEGGRFGGGEEERLRSLYAAIDAGAAYIDIEVKTEAGLRRALIERATAARTRTIASWHDFTTTASSQGLMTILQEQYKSGAHIGKIVTTARDFNDVLRVLSLQTAAHEMGFPLIAFCMGEAGRVSRAATCLLGGFMTYAAPDGGVATAPGQLPASDLREILKRLGHGH